MTVFAIVWQKHYLNCLVLAADGFKTLDVKSFAAALSTDFYLSVGISVGGMLGLSSG